MAQNLHSSVRGKVKGLKNYRPKTLKLHYVFDTGSSGIRPRARFSGKKGSFEPSEKHIPIC